MTWVRHAVIPSLLTICACGGEVRTAPAAAARSQSVVIGLPQDPFALAAVLSVPVDSLRAAGEERYTRQEFDSARAIWRIELRRAVSAVDRAAEARVRMWLGLAAYRLGDYASSRSEGEASLTLKRAAGLDNELSRSFNALGLLAWNEGRHREALMAFDSAVATAKRHDDLAGVTRAVANIPLVKVELGDFDGARAGFEQAIREGKKLEDDRVQGNALANLAMLEIRLGNARRALPLLAIARQHYAAIEYSTGEANALGQLATAFSSLGDLQSALTVADSALRISRAQGLQQETAATLEVVADLQAQAGNLRLALRSLRQADSLNRRLGLAVEQGTNLRRTSLILSALGEFAPAIAAARRALATHQSVEARGEEVYDRMQLADALAQSGDVREAVAEAAGALSLSRQLDNPATLRNATAVAARLALRSGNPRRALEHLGRTWKPAADDDWRLLDLRAQTLLALGKTEDASFAGVRAIDVLERERASLAVGPLRSSFLVSRAAPFAHMVAVHLARGDTAAAFEIATRVPGRSLSERLSGIDARRGGVLWVAEGERWLREVAAIEAELASTNEAGDRKVLLERALAASRASYEMHLASRPRDSGNAKLLSSRRVSLADVQSRIGTDEGVLLCLSGPDQVDCFLVRKNRVAHWRSLVPDRALAQRIRVIRETMLRSRDPSRVPAGLGELHEILLGSDVATTALADLSKLVVIPHGALGALPFAALWNRKSGRFLIQDIDLVYLPSASALSVRASARTGATPATMIFAPMPNSLPASVSESRAVAKSVMKAKIHIGRESDERDIKLAITKGLPVHIASHGSHNAQNPLFSRIHVGRARQDPSEDGELEVHEIIGMITTSPLVFLSGCETGLGSAADGPFAQAADEGSLAHAFMIAGAQQVVATLWRVSDIGAARIAEGFYREARAGRTYESALAAAQREAIRQGHGLTWAAYSINGLAGAN